MAFSKAKWLSFIRKCPCSGKKSVQVTEKAIQRLKSTSTQQSKSVSLAEAQEKVNYKSTVLKPQELKTDWNQRNQLFSQVSEGTIFNEHCANGFTFPIFNSENKIGKSLSSFSSSLSAIVIDPTRDSLEVFRPTQLSKSPGYSSRISNEFTFKTTSPKSMVVVNNDMDDVASDASSDLFEIESFSTDQTTTTNTNSTPTTHPSMFLYQNSQNRHSLDDSYSSSSFQRKFGTNGEMGLYSRRSLDQPRTLSTEYCYEPSEASIDWSVTTAEGFDRSSCVCIDHFATDDDQLVSEKN